MSEWVATCKVFVRFVSGADAIERDEIHCENASCPQPSTTRGSVRLATPSSKSSPWGKLYNDNTVNWCVYTLVQISACPRAQYTCSHAHLPAVYHDWLVAGALLVSLYLTDEIQHTSTVVRNATLWPCHVLEVMQRARLALLHNRHRQETTLHKKSSENRSTTNMNKSSLLSGRN